MQQQSYPLTISIIIPVYSGEAFLGKLTSSIDALRSRWQNLGLDLQISESIFVLDEPIDESTKLLRKLSTTYPWVRLVEMSRNYGQHSATIAGILYSSGDWVVTLDEDLQHQPTQIEGMLKMACSEKSDIVYASPNGSVHGAGYRDRLSKFTKFIIAKMSGNQFVQTFNSFRLIRGDIARAAASVGAQYTYFDVTLTWFTERISSVKMTISDDRYKQKKRSGYRLGTLIQHATKLILTSNLRALRFTSSLSALAFLSALIYSGWVLYSRLFASNPVDVPGWTSLMIVILAFGSVSVFILGLIVEFLHTSTLQLQGKPTFFVVNRTSDPKLAQEVDKLYDQ